MKNSGNTSARRRQISGRIKNVTEFAARFYCSIVMCGTIIRIKLEDNSVCFQEIVLRKSKRESNQGDFCGLQEADAL